MSLPAEKVAEVLALAAPDRAYLAQQLIASLDPQQDAGAEVQWHEVIYRRTRELRRARSPAVLSMKWWRTSAPN